MYLTHLTLEYPPRSMTFKYRTNSPDEVNMTILNSILMGGRLHAFRWVSLDNVASPENEYSAPPANRAILTCQPPKTL
jgi:hypothetical protein